MKGACVNMKSSPQLVKSMNAVLAEELAEELAVIHERKDTGILITRILFLEGKPIISELKRINLGNDLTSLFINNTDRLDTSFDEVSSDVNLNIAMIEKDLDTISRLTLE